MVTYLIVIVTQSRALDLGRSAECPVVDKVYVAKFCIIDTALNTILSQRTRKDNLNLRRIKIKSRKAIAMILYFVKQFKEPNSLLSRSNFLSVLDHSVFPIYFDFTFLRRMLANFHKSFQLWDLVRLFYYTLIRITTFTVLTFWTEMNRALTVFFEHANSTLFLQILANISFFFQFTCFCFSDPFSAFYPSKRYIEFLFPLREVSNLSQV